MDNERLAADAVALYSSVSSFLRRFRSEIESACAGPVQLDLLDSIGQLADAILHDDALMDASRTALATVPDSLDVSAVVAHVTRLRGCIVSVWEREIGADHPAALCALHEALDRLVQLVVERIDVSDRKSMENELRHAVRQREDLIAIVSHDLRNPLGTITLGSTLIRTDETLSSPSRRHVEMIHRSALRMERLIDDLLDMSQIQLGRLSLHLERIPAQHAVREAVESLQALALEKRILLTTDTRLAGVEITVDAERLQRVFSNLIGNALKFCAAGDEVRVAGEVSDPTHVRFSVEDSGPGIEPDALPCLFDPYWSSPDHARRGVGLGLFICNGIVTAHGGTIGVESEVGQGTTFHIVLPISR